MKLIYKNIEKDGKGTITLIPDETEDMWHLYNLISEGDSVCASTIRKVQTERETGATLSNRVRTTLTICVETIDFDTYICSLRLKGRNIQENEYVKMGAYHTLDIELNRKFSLTKDEWDCVALDRIEMACDPTKNADAAAVIMQEGLAHICLITSNMTMVRSKIDINIPKKRKGNTKQYEKALTKFFETVMQGILRHVNFDVVKVVLLASPGVVREQFKEYMIQEASRTDNKVILENRSKFLLVQSSSGFKHSLKEVLMDQTVAYKMANTKALTEVRALETFFQMLKSDPSRAFYGMKHIEKANESQAIETLLILDSVLRCKDIAQRKKLVNLIESVRDFGGDVKVFSSMHISGEQLANITGIAAILRFPLPELEEEDATHSKEAQSSTT